MVGYISSIKYIKINKNEGYFSVTLEDAIGNKLGTFGNKNFSSPVEFRKETFGIMAAINCFDLTKIGFNIPDKLEVGLEFDKFDRVQKIINKKGVTFFKNEKYLYESKINLKDLLFGKEIQEKWTIENIKSQSNTFSVFLMNEHGGGIGYVTNSVYYGFGFPLITCSEPNSADILSASLEYMTFIKSILKLYGTDDLMKLCKTTPMRRKVDVIVLENGSIVGIGNSEKDIYLVSGENTYTIVNSDMLQQKVLRLK